jgi:hypothetical protein
MGWNWNAIKFERRSLIEWLGNKNDYIKRKPIEKQKNWLLNIYLNKIYLGLHILFWRKLNMILG